MRGLIVRLTAAVLAFGGCALAGPPASAAPAATQTAVFAGGCFWGMEAVFESLKGVRSVTSGFAGGASATAHYELVSTGLTGHAESVRVDFDPERISYAQLLRVFFIAHDPTQLNRQGPDNGSQYRSSIFYTTGAQQREAQSAIRDLERRHVFQAPIVTTVVPLRGFYTAEAYHQHYAALHPDDPYIATYDLPKLALLRRTYPSLVDAHAQTAALAR